jgi:hypothetical protein
MTDVFSKKSKVAPDDVLAMRRGVCDSCEHKTANFLCGKCGCIILLKTRKNNSECPVGKWGKA